MFSCAYADGAQQGQSSIMAFMPILAIMVIMYFLVIRPQQKKQKAHQNLLASLKPGDKVMTGGGLIAKIVKILSENEVIVEISDNVQCKFVKSAIISVIQDSPASKDSMVSSK